MSELVPIASELIRRYNLQNVQTINAQPNPYQSRIPNSIAIDKELYKSKLGTPVFSDITFGDKINQENNQWTDNNGKVQSFQPLTLATVLMSVVFPKKVIETEIQGRNGTVKEYIGQGDAQITISGLILGTNGHYPIDEVKQLKKILDAPIPIVVTSWYLQNLDIDLIVIKEPSISQTEGGYSYETFNINAVSDTPVELRINV